jgi:pimeloyl-ACP methyl ester carboxylesterase
MADPKLHRIFNCDEGKQVGDVIFVHGLGGDAFDTWKHKSNSTNGSSWLYWLGKELIDVAIWSLGYDAAPVGWMGGTMPLVDRANNILELLQQQGIGSRPVLFIAHSLGGLLVKQMLQNASTFGSEWNDIVNQTQGIIFLATPHSGSDWANWFSYIENLTAKTDTIDELKKNSPHLRNLNTAFVNSQYLCQVKVYYETQPLAGIGLVVDQSSANPGIKGVIPVAIDANHLDICKPEKAEGLVYNGAKQFIEKCFNT